MTEVKRRVRFKWFRFILMGLFIYCVYLTIGQHHQLNAICRETDNTRARLEEANKTKAALLDERTRLNDRSYIEKLAREDLGLVRPGEAPFITGPKN
ncbi:MAG: septum formation initiator family protein [Pelosinus sp.]|nr:septum formation initiator family protein [Pelosinus sp.]